MKAPSSKRPSGQAMFTAGGTVILLRVLAACAGEPGDGGGTGGTGASSGGGIGGTGNAGTGGIGGSTSGTGGSGGNAGTGGSTGGEGGGMNWCDPPDTEVGIIYPCFGYDPEANGIPPSSDLDVSSFELGESTSPGEAYAFAVEMYSGGSITVEIWGSDANCGPGKEMLFSMPFQDVGLYCVDTVPALEHSHLLFITRRGNAGFQNFTFCPGVECKVQGPFRVTGAAGVRHVNR